MLVGVIVSTLSVEVADFGYVLLCDCVITFLDLELEIAFLGLRFLYLKSLWIRQLKRGWNLVWYFLVRSSQVLVTMRVSAILAVLARAVRLLVETAHLRLVVVVGDLHHPALRLL